MRRQHEEEEKSYGKHNAASYGVWDVLFFFFFFGFVAVI